MPPSQLKRLKASLREQGITAPQKSKKQKKNGQGQNAEHRVQRQAALQGIRDSFNPFEIKAPVRPAKFQATSSKDIHGKSARTAVGRPGVTKSMGEEARRKTLLPEMQRRNKIGGVIDRRIGETDPTMTPEERALQRFAQERQRKSKISSTFDLEDADEEDNLTHMGRTLDLTGKRVDDFDADGISGSEAGSDDEGRFLKRRRPNAEPDAAVEGALAEGEEDEPDRKRSRQEVMKEVMAKSKLYKYERQKAKEDDEELREELDKGMADMLSLLRGHKKPEPKPEAITNNGEPTMNPERLAMLNGLSRQQADKEYDTRLRQLAMDQRAAPAERTKTDEEKAADEASRLKELEEARRKRMRGEESEEEEDEAVQEDQMSGVNVEAEEEEIRDDAADFGLGSSGRRQKLPALEEEDEFELDEDLIASGSDIDLSSASDDSESEGSDDEEVTDKHSEDEENEFVRGILDDVDGKNKPSETKPDSLAYTYACPRTHAELLTLIEDVPVQDVPTIVQRIRALYHPSLAAENKNKLADFSVTLVDHISYMAMTKQPMPIIETLIRHIHSLSRSYNETIATAFRAHLTQFHQRGQPTAGDLVIVTAISTIYPTSDHFHQVVTPAITLMARWLEMNPPNSASSMATGAFLVALCLRYQRLSQRYIPEAVRFTLQALRVRPQPPPAQLQPHIDNLLSMAELWHFKPAFTEIFAPPSTQALSSLKPIPKKAIQHLTILLQQARLRRRPLELHHHKPLPIRTSYPKFEDEFDPHKHYDPDRARADSAKLRKEYKREKKGALRELRKDANFVAREQLRDKRERDAEYEKKYKRLVAEIQGTEGHEANEYEREKRMRKGKGTR